MLQNSFSGTWKLNLAASSFPFPQPRSVVLDIVVEGDEVSLTENSINAEGSTETVRILARFDNQIYPVNGTELCDGFAVERLDERTWRARGTRSGQVVFTETILLASDGASFREEAETTIADGSRAPATLVYERQ